MKPVGISGKISLTRFWGLERRGGLVLFFLLTLWLSFFHHLGSVPLFDRDEGAFSEATREMFERSDFISTYLNGEPRYDKPILIYWFQAVSVYLLGLNEFALRFPSALFASFWALAIFFFSRRYLDYKTAIAATAFMATSFWTMVIGRAAIADALLNFTICLTLFNIYHYFKNPRKKYIYLSFFCLGAGVLTKGPIAIVIASLTSLIFFTLQKKLKELKRLAFHPGGILTFFLTALPWYILQYLKEGQGFLEGFFFKHNLSRFTSPMEGHGGAFFYYLPILLVILLPYSTLFIRLIASHLKSLYQDELDAFLWIWFLVVLIFFSLAQTKLPHYILHGATPLFILMARYRNSVTSTFWMLLPPLLFFLIVFFLPEIITLAKPHITDEYARAVLKDAVDRFPSGYRIMSLLSLAIIGALAFLSRATPWKKVLASGYVSVFLSVNCVLPVVAAVQQGPIVDAVRFVGKNNYDLVMWKLDNPSFSLYRKKVTPWREPEAGELVMTKLSLLNRFSKYELLFQKGGIVIARVVEK